MRLQAYDDNGTMKFRQVSGSQALDSLPVGTTISYSGSVAPNGYLFCDGSTFDTAEYPELFSKLGTNVLPVWSDPSQPTAKLPINGTGSIQFNLTTTNTAAPYDGIINFGYSIAHVRTIYINDVPRAISGNSESGNTTQVQVKKGDLVRVQLSLDTAANYNWAIWYTKPKLIKAATIGIADIDINTIKQELTYSTEETLTGKTWIDGKPIYRKTYYSSTNWANNANVDTISGIDFVVHISDIAAAENSKYYNGFSDDANIAKSYIQNGTIIARRTGAFANQSPSAITIEYTKQ